MPANPNDPQAAVIAALADATLPGLEPASGCSCRSNTHAPTDRTADVQRIDTHCAHVFLHERIALKIKRPVRFSYLDASTLQHRRELCERELTLNRNALPDIYLDVVPLVQCADGSHALGGEGITVEWVLRMRRFAEEDVLDSVARAGDLTPELANTIGTDLAQWHENLASVAVRDGHARLIEIVDELEREFDALQDRLPPDEVTPVVQRLRNRVDACASLLDDRARAGFIRRCHGDLHLRNLLLHKGRVVPFDALEFDERLATTDVLYDLAFLIMDLGDRELFEAQNRALNAWLSHSDACHLDGLAAFPAMLACRALIRAMTSAQSAAINADDTGSALDEARAYALEAMLYLRERRPRLIVIGGLSGTGKSTLAGRLAFTLAGTPGCIVLRSDTERKAMSGVDDDETLPSSAYERGPGARLYSRLRDRAARALASGMTVLIDATYIEQRERDGIAGVASDADVPLEALWLHAQADTNRARIGARTNDVSDADVPVFEQQLSTCTPPDDWRWIDADGSPAMTFAAATNELGCHDHPTVP